MSTILQTLRGDLKAAGFSRWPEIASSINATRPEGAPTVSVHLMRKIAYGDRKNPTLSRIQPLLDYFEQRRAAGGGENAQA